MSILMENLMSDKRSQTCPKSSESAKYSMTLLSVKMIWLVYIGGKANAKANVTSLPGGFNRESTLIFTQECIPVGCVPPSAVAVSPATHVPSPFTMHDPFTTHAPPLPCMPVFAMHAHPSQRMFHPPLPHPPLFAIHMPLHHARPQPCTPL